MRKVWQIVFNPLCRYRCRDWLWFILPTVIFLSLLLGTGPLIQEAISRSIGSMSPVREQAIAKLPTLTFWIASSLLHPYALISLVSVVIALRREQVAAPAVWLAICIGSLITLVDVIYVATGVDPDIPFPETIFFNYIGGAIAAFLYIALFSLYLYIYSYYQNSRISKRIYPAAITIFLGLLLSSCIYYFISFLDTPRRSPLHATFRENALGYMVSPQTASAPEHILDDGDTEERGFSLVPRDRIRGVLRVANFANSNFRASWSSLSKDEERIVEIRLFRDCPFFDIDDLPKNSPSISIPVLKNIDVDISSGMTDLLSNISGWMRVYGDSFISLDNKDMNLDSRSITGFLDESSKIRLAHGDDMEFLVGAGLLEHNGDTSSPRSALFVVTVDGERHEFNFKPDHEFDKDRKLECRGLSALTSDGGSSTHSSTGYASILVSVITVRHSSIYRAHSQTLELENMSGWYKLDDIPLEDVRNESLGQFTIMLGQTGMTRLELGGKSIPVRSDDRIDAYGEFRGRYDRQGGLKITGETYAIWKNGVRANLTRWELLAGEIQAALIALALALIGATATVIRRCVVSHGGLNRRSALSL